MFMFKTSTNVTQITEAVNIAAGTVREATSVHVRQVINWLQTKEHA